MALHTLALCLGVFIQAAGAFLHPAFTARVGANYVQTPGQPVLFDDVITNVGNLYNQSTKTIRIPRDGIYWITLSIHPAKVNVTLLLNINGQKSKFYAWTNGIHSSKSGGFTLQHGNALTVVQEGGWYLEKDTLWSVVYTGWGSQAFLGQFSGMWTLQLPVPFPDVITSQSSSIHQNPITREFTVLVDSLHIVHLSAVGDHNLTLILQKQVPWVSVRWSEILWTGPTQSGVDAVFNLAEGERLRVMRSPQSTQSEWLRTTFSIVSIGTAHCDNTTAFTGEVRHPVRLYAPNKPVKFDFEHVNIDNSYNAWTGIYTVPSDSVYIVSLRPMAAPPSVMSYKDHRTVTTACCKPLTFTLRNATHEVFRVTTDYYLPTGASAAVYLRAGDKLKVFAEAPDDSYRGVLSGSLFSIANLYCPAPQDRRT